MELKIGTLKKYPVSATGKVDKDVQPKKERGPKVWTQKYIDSINDGTKSHGQFIDVDEKATKKYLEDLEEAIKRREQVRKDQQVLEAATLARAAEGAARLVTGQPLEPVQESEDNESIPELKERIAALEQKLAKKPQDAPKDTTTPKASEQPKAPPAKKAPTKTTTKDTDKPKA